MQNKPDPSMDLTQILRMAQSPAGQQLISMLQQQNGEALRSAMSKASAGDYSQAKKTISEFLSKPEAKALLEQLEGSK